MISISPFESVAEHRLYCEAAGAVFEEDAIGFKIFGDGEKLGVCQLQFVGTAAYLLTLKSIGDTITSQLLASLFVDVVEFLLRVGITSLVYPIQSDGDATIANLLGFDKVSETLYVFDFPEEEKTES